MSFFDEVSKISYQSTENNEDRNQERYKKAEDMAFNKITKKMKEKMLSEAKAGFQSAVIHTWKFVKNRDDPSCIGTSKFNGVWINDLCFKGNLLTRITDTLNEGNKNETKFRVFVKKLKRNNTINIIVSWKPLVKKEKDESDE
jgi:hypothetical protein